MPEKSRLPAGLTLRGDSYVVQYWDGHAWRRQAVGSELDAALEAHRKLRHEKKQPAAVGDEKPEPPAVFTFQRLFDAWWADQRLRNKPNTLRTSGERAECLVATIGAQRPAASLTSDDVARFVQARRKAGTADVTINGYLRILRAMLNWAANEELLERSPVRIRLLRTLDRKHVEVFTPEEIEEVLDHACPKIRMLVTIIAASGMRREEALHLQWMDVDFTRGRIDIRGKRYQHRRRDRSTVELVWTPKNYEERSVYVTPDVVRALQRFRSEQRWNDPEDWIFQSDKRRRQAGPARPSPSIRRSRTQGSTSPGSSSTPSGIPSGRACSAPPTWRRPAPSSATGTSRRR